jgi:tetratricopeptide (TPR) repeat protein
LQQPYFRLRIAVIVVLAICVAAAYAPTLGAGWVYDDVNLVEPSPALKDLAGLGSAISTDLYRQAAPRLEASPYWRPLAMASFWLDTRFGPAPLALHFGNILLHALATALLALVVMRRHGGAAGIIAAVLAAAWWALHPENVEAVAWISCRYDLLCGVALLCLLAVPWQPGPLRAALYGLIFLAGLLSKEGFGAMAAVVVAMDFADQRPVRAAVPRWVAVVIAVAIWWVLRAAIRIPSPIPPTFDMLLTMLYAYPEALAIYFWRALVPPPLTISHPYTPGSVFEIAAGVAIFVALVAAALRWRRLAVPVTIFLAGFILTVGAITMFHDVSERYFYLPSIGLALLIGELVALAVSARYQLVRVIVPAVVVVVTLLGFVRLEQRLPDWQSDGTLWTAAVQVDPLDPQANFNQAIAAGKRGDWNTALQAIKTAAHGDPSSARIASAYAWALIQTSDFAGAAREAERATVLAPYQPDGWYYLAFARHKIGDHRGELAAIDKLLQVAPDYPRARDMREVAACEVSGQTNCLPDK